MAQKLIFSAPHTVAYEELPLREPEPGEVLARTVLSGISHGTEMTAFLGTSPFIERTITPERIFRAKTSDDPDFYPFHWAGYDAVGVVERVGAGVTKYQPGDRVWRQVTHQTAFLFPEDAADAIRLADDVPDEDAIMLNLSSVSLGAIVDAEIKLGDVVAVFGGGLVGQMAVQMAYLSGARQVFLVEPTAERRTFAAAKTAVATIDPTQQTPALAIQAITDGKYPDVCIECSGNVAGLHSAVQAAGVAGTVIAAGFYAGSASALFLGEELMHNRVTIKASMSKWGCPSRFRQWDEGRLLRETYHLLAARRLNLTGIVTGRFPFTDAQHAYEAVRDEPGRYLKVALTY